MTGPSTGGAPRIIDLRFLDQPGVIAAFLLFDGREAALIEVGPASTVETLLAAVEAAGVRHEQIQHLLVTHVHLDHAGAAGLLLQRLPNATLYVHELGAPHLIDPAKLISSASRIYGALMKRLWGEIIPVPTDRVARLRDGNLVTVAGRRLEVHYTPGHAIHHVSYHDPDARVVYAGDVAGVRLNGFGYVRPPTPPPDVDLEAWDTSLDLLADLAPRGLYVTHFGYCEGVQEHLSALRTRLRQWETLVVNGLRAGQDHTDIAIALQRTGDEELLRLGADADLIKRYEQAGGYAMSAAGYERYLRKRHPELLPPAAG